MKGKCTRDAFYFYKVKFERENEGRRVFNGGITNIELAARESWRSMTLQQRDPYEELAKQAAPTRNKTTKADKNVLSKSLVDAHDNKIVHEIVTQSVRNNTVRSKEYHFIAANIFCQTDLNKCLPAEMALLKFSLQDGVIGTYHTYINPETIPMGYKFTALQLSETTHDLPLPPNAMGEKNLAVIQQRIDKFIGDAQECKQGFVPVFTLAENVRILESICRDLGSTSNEASGRHYKVLSINQLLFELKTSIQRNLDDTLEMASVDDATTRLNGEKYKFLCEIACEFHDAKDCSKYCCLSDVKRWAYVFSETCCPDMQIPCVRGKHFPMEATAIDVGAILESNCDQKHQRNANLDTDEADLCAGVTKSLPARRARRQRNYFAEDGYVRRSLGMGRGARRE